MDRNKMVKEMMDYGFVCDIKKNDVDLMKEYKCYCSKKCNDEKYDRIKRMFDYVKYDLDFKKLMGNDYNKLCESFISESRGEGVKKIDFNGMGIMDVFSMYKLGVKEVCKKGYVVENDIYIKV